MSFASPRDFRYPGSVKQSRIGGLLKYMDKLVAPNCLALFLGCVLASVCLAGEERIDASDPTVGDVLVFTGKDYVTNARYSVRNKQMVIDAPEMRVVLEELEESV